MEFFNGENSLRAAEIKLDRLDATIHAASLMKSLRDDGARREFPTGAVRDISDGKGRCDLLPLDIVAEILEADELRQIEKFKRFKNVSYLYSALDIFSTKLYAFDFDNPLTHRCTMLLELGKHFEAGAKKYGENNWKKGMPIHCYIDSAVRHYIKFARRDVDEPHERAFAWNILCAIWTFENLPELDDIEKDI